MSSLTFTSSYNAILQNGIAMSIYSDTVNGILFLRPNQDVDRKVGKEIQERLTIAVNDGVAYVIIDFSLSALVSAAILRIIIDTANQIQRHRGCIVITGANPQLRSLLLISDVLKLAPAFTSIAEAQAHLRTVMGSSDGFFAKDDDDI
jgi:anti-anti-sigma regulatory factor